MFDVLEVRRETVRVGLCPYTSMKGERMYKMWIMARINLEGERVIVTTPPDFFIQPSLHSSIVHAVVDAWKVKFVNSNSI